MWWRKCRRFAVGSRKDYRTSIADALRALKLCETKTEHWEVYWGDQWLKTEEFVRDSIRPNALANSIPGFRDSFGEKKAFARLHANCLEQQKRDEEGEEVDYEEDADGDPTIKLRKSSNKTATSAAKRQTRAKLFCGWTKAGFSIEKSGDELEGPLDEFREHSIALANSHGGDRNEFPQLWILKPQQSFNQLGISMVYIEQKDVVSPEATMHWMGNTLPVDGSWTLQEYVRHPLLYRGRKFDMRVWAVITSIDPLRIYLLDHAFPKVSTVPYSASWASVGRHCLSSPQCACMHVRMPLGEGCEKDNLISPYPSRTDTSLFKTGLRFGPSFVGRGALREEYTIWERVVMPQIERILITAVLLAREAGALQQHKLVQATSPHKCASAAQHGQHSTTAAPTHTSLSVQACATPFP